MQWLTVRRSLEEEKGGTEVMASGKKVAAATAFGAVAFLVTYLWESIWAIPIFAFTAFTGPILATLVLVPLYAEVEFWLSMKYVKIHQQRFAKKEHESPSRLGTWLEKKAESLDETRLGKWVRRLLKSGKATGFVLASFLAGGLPVTVFLYHKGERQNLRSIARLSCWIFGATFVPIYAFGFAAVYTWVFKAVWRALSA